MDESTPARVDITYRRRNDWLTEQLRAETEYLTSELASANRRIGILHAVSVIRVALADGDALAGIEACDQLSREAVQ